MCGWTTTWYTGTPVHSQASAGKQPYAVTNPHTGYWSSYVDSAAGKGTAYYYAVCGSGPLRETARITRTSHPPLPARGTVKPEDFYNGFMLYGDYGGPAPEEGWDDPDIVILLFRCVPGGAGQQGNRLDYPERSAYRVGTRVPRGREARDQGTAGNPGRMRTTSGSTRPRTR